MVGQDEEAVSRIVSATNQLKQVLNQIEAGATVIVTSYNGSQPKDRPSVELAYELARQRCGCRGGFRTTLKSDPIKVTRVGDKTTFVVPVDNREITIDFVGDDIKFLVGGIRDILDPDIKTEAPRTKLRYMILRLQAVHVDEESLTGAGV